MYKDKCGLSQKELFALSACPECGHVCGLKEDIGHWCEGEGCCYVKECPCDCQWHDFYETHLNTQ